jgi:hypothetical protein
MAASGVHPPEAPIVRIGGGTVVNNLQYLTEKDFEYFRNKQKDGDPVRIIYLDPETLDKISFDDIDRMEKEARDKNGEQPTAEEMEQWLKDRGAVMDAKKAEEKAKAEKQAAQKVEQEKAAGKKTDKQKGTGTTADASKRILDIIKEGKLSAGQINIIVQAIKDGFTADELEYLYSLTMDSEQMTREYERIRKEKTDGKG